MRPRESHVNHISLDTENEVVKQFFLSLPGDPDGSVVELNGEAVARVLPVRSQPEVQGSSDGWTEAKNARRCGLIDKEIDGKLSPDEALELESLQAEMLRYRRKFAPLPLAGVRQLHQELLAKAAKANTPS